MPAFVHAAATGFFNEDSMEQIGHLTLNATALRHLVSLVLQINVVLAVAVLNRVIYIYIYIYIYSKPGFIFFWGIIIVYCSKITRHSSSSIALNVVCLYICQRILHSRSYSLVLICLILA